MPDSTAVSNVVPAADQAADHVALRTAIFAAADLRVVDHNKRGSYSTSNLFAYPANRAVRRRLTGVYGDDWEWTIAHVGVQAYDSGSRTKYRATVAGQLTLHLPDGRVRTRAGTGGADMTDESNAVKGAASVALVKAAAEFGIAAELDSLDTRDVVLLHDKDCVFAPESARGGDIRDSIEKYLWRHVRELYELNGRPLADTDDEQERTNKIAAVARRYGHDVPAMTVEHLKPVVRSVCGAIYDKRRELGF